MWKKILILTMVIALAGCTNPKQKKADELIDKGQKLCLKGQCEESLKYFKQAIEESPEYADAYYNIGIIYENTNRLNKAIDSYKEALRLKKDHEEANEALVLAFVKLKQFVTAKEQLESFIEKNPENASGYILLSKINVLDNQLDKSVENLNKALSIDPQSADAYFNLAAVNYQLNKPDEAKKDYEKALELDPQHINAMINLAGIYAKDKDYTKALEIYTKILAIDPESLVANFNMGIIYGLIDDLPQARDKFTKVIQINPNLIDAHYNLAIVYKKTGQDDAMKKEIAIIEHLRPDLKGKINVEQMDINPGKKDDKKPKPKK